MIRGDALSTAGFTAGAAVARPLTAHPHSLAWGRPGGAIARKRIRCDSHRRFALQLPGLHDRPHTTSQQRRRAIQSPVQPLRGPGQQRYRLGDLFPRASCDQTSHPDGRSQVELRTTRQAGNGTPQDLIQIPAAPGQAWQRENGLAMLLRMSSLNPVEFSVRVTSPSEANYTAEARSIQAAAAARRTHVVKLEQIVFFST